MRASLFILFILIFIVSFQKNTSAQAIDTPFRPWNFNPDLAGAIKQEYTSAYMQSRPPRMVANFTSQWTFNYFPSNKEDHALTDPAYNDGEWPSIAIPHTWQTFETTHEVHPYIKNASERDDAYWWKGWGVYRKRFELSLELKDKKVFLEFDGVQKYARVYVNGILIGDHKGGFNSFSFDVTSAIQWGQENVLTVLVNNFRRDKYKIPPMTAGNWNLYGGIYRDVRLVLKNKVHIPFQGSADHEGGTFVTTPQVSKETAQARIITYVANASLKTQKVVLSTTLQDPDGKHITTLKEEEQMIAGQSTISFDQLTHLIQNPKLWHPNAPNLYKVISKIYLDGIIQDTYESPLGFRFYSWDFEHDQLYVNGEKLQIKGTNRHQEYPWLGDAIPDWIHINDMLDIKYGLGHNFMRAAHYPNDPLIYDLADQLGIVMVEEVPNIKNIGFNEAVQEQNVKEMIRRDRNHPSIFFWSMGNETSDGADSKWAILEDTTRLIHARKSSDVGDFVNHDHRNLDMENLLRVSIRGWFTQDDAPDSIDVHPKNGQHASSESWQHQMAMKRGGSVRGILNDNTVAWLYEDHGADREYKNTPVLHINPKGWVDNYRIPKYVYFLTRANYVDEPLIFVHPHYWRQQYLGTRQDLVIDSNCDEVEIFVNGISKGLVYPSASEFNSVVLKGLEIEQGTLMAKGKKEGKNIETKIHMPAAAHKIILSSTHQDLVADQSGLAIITAYVVDDAGKLVFDSKNELKWEVSGPARLVGYDTFRTDADKHESMEGIGYISGPVSNVIRTTQEAGRIKVTASSEGLIEGEIILQSFKTEAQKTAERQRARGTDKKTTGISQPLISQQDRLPVTREEDYMNKIIFKEVISKVTENQKFSGKNKKEYSHALDKFIRQQNKELNDYTIAYPLFVEQLSQNLVKLNGTLIADDFNFLAEQFNNYVMLANALETINLHIQYASLLKDYYATLVLHFNQQIDFEQEIKLLQSIPKEHIPLYLQEPDMAHKTGEVLPNNALATASVWATNPAEGIQYAFPAYKSLSEEERQLAFQYIARISPHASYDRQSKTFTWSKEKPLIIPQADARAFIDDFKANNWEEFLED